MNRPLSLAFLTLLVGVPALSAVSSAAPTAVEKVPATAYSAANVKAGQEVFLKRCYACHSVAEGEVRLGPSLYHEMQGKPPKKNFAQMREQILLGKNKMPPFKEILTPEQIDQVIAYVHSL